MQRVLALLLAVLLALLTGCAQKAPPVKEGATIDPPAPAAAAADQGAAGDSDWLTIYLIQGELLVPVSIRREQATSSLLSDTLEALLSWNSPEWAVSPLPVTTKINRIFKNGDLAVIDFNAETIKGFSGGTLGESLLLQSLVMTLTGIEGIRRVMIMVDGKTLEAAFGHIDTSKPLEPPAAFNIEQPAAPEGAVYVRLWFSDRQAMFAVPVNRQVSKNDYSVQTALQELLRGPKSGSTLVSPFPGRSVVRSLTVEGKTCKVDFTREFVANLTGGSAGERQIIQTLVLTLTEFKEIEEVKFLVEGEPGDALLGHLNTSGTFKRGFPNPFN